jgi:hypothetical protein
LRIPGVIRGWDGAGMGGMGPCVVRVVVRGVVGGRLKE